MFRGEQTNGISYIYLGRSKDAIHWDFDENKIRFVDETGKEFMPVYAYDPRLVKVEDTYYIIWCQDFYGAAIGMAKTTDVKYRCQNFLLTPEEWYEERGFVPNVTFPCATIHDSETGRIAIYYGAADTYVGFAFTTVEGIVDYIKKNSVIRPSDTEIGRR